MSLLNELDRHVQNAVAFYWKTRSSQVDRQKAKNTLDQGLRSAVTGGKQMDGFIALLTKLIVEAGMPENCIHHERALQLPGYFRPTKEWDLLVVKDEQLVVAIECKSQVGPSFGNNFNNRTEEAMGSALDLWTAFREEKFNTTIRPWLGYTFLLESCPRSESPVKVDEPHFQVFPEFKNASYAKRYELFCRRLVLERHYTSAAFMLSKIGAMNGAYFEPATDLQYAQFARSLVGHVAAVTGKITRL
jgi:hypothetical protein